MSRKFTIILTALVFFAITIAATADKGYKIGDKAMDFKLKGVNDQEVSYASFPDAKGFIVIFTCNHCPYAKLYEDRIIALDKKYKAMGYPVIAINPNDPELAPTDDMEHMKERAKEKGFTFPYLMDQTQDVYRTFGASRTPHVFVLQRSGSDHIVQYTGAIDDNYEDESAVTTRYVEDAVSALLSGKEIKTKETKAIGCSIKDKQK